MTSIAPEDTSSLPGAGPAMPAARSAGRYFGLPRLATCSGGKYPRSLSGPALLAAVLYLGRVSPRYAKGETFAETAGDDR